MSNNDFKDWIGKSASLGVCVTPTKLYDRTRERLTQDEAESIKL